MTIFYRFLISLVIVFLAYSPSSSAVHFVLIHGFGHGAWCWYKLATLLEQAGHNVTAVDLAYSGRNQVPISSVHTINGYHKPLFKYLECLSPEDKVILVGHSYGGYAVSSAMERYPTKLVGAVFVSAYMVGPNLTFSQTIKDLKLAIYSVRASQLFYGNLTNRQLLVTKERYGSVPRAYVIGGQDMVIPPIVQRFLIASNPPKVVREIQGADHMVMLSKPQEFANSLREIAALFGVS